MRDELNTRKTPENIFITLLQGLSNVVRIQLNYMCYRIMRLGYFPSDLKVSQIKMIANPGKDWTNMTSWGHQSPTGYFKIM